MFFLTNPTLLLLALEQVSYAELVIRVHWWKHNFNTKNMSKFHFCGDVIWNSIIKGREIITPS